jgi:hypothetical protein
MIHDHLKLKQRRLNYGASLRDIAALIPCGAPTLHRWEYGAALQPYKLKAWREALSRFRQHRRRHEHRRSPGPK